MPLQQSFPFGTDYMSWDDWNGNFAMWYGEEPIPVLSEEEWYEVANAICQLPTFLAYPVPNPDGFETWQDWAGAVSIIINGPSQ